MEKIEKTEKVEMNWQGKFFYLAGLLDGMAASGADTDIKMSAEHWEITKAYLNIVDLYNVRND